MASAGPAFSSQMCYQCWSCNLVMSQLKGLLFLLFQENEKNLGSCATGLRETPRAVSS